MTLTLRIRNVDRLDNGMPAEFLLNRRGAIIGRAATCDWSLPDPRSYISSRHAEVSFRDGFYFFSDISTNGTFLNGGSDRMSEPRRIEQGDVFLLGHYEVEAGLSGAAVVAIEQQEEQAASAAQQAGGFGWDAAGGDAAPAPSTPDRGGWGDATPNGGLAGGAGGMAAPLDGGWGAPAAPATDDSDWGAAAAPTAPADSGWGAAPPPSGGASDWGAAPAAPAPPSGSDWGAASARDHGGGWGASPASSPAAAPAAPSWAPAPAGPSLSAPAPYAGAGAMAPVSAPSPAAGGNGWAPPVQAEPERAASPWDSAQAPVQQASAWSSAASDRPKDAAPNDIWGSMEQSNVVDWGRAFGEKPAESKDLLGLDKKPADSLPKALPPAPVAASPTDVGGWGAEPAAPTDAGGWGAEPAAVPSPPAPASASPAPVARERAPAPPPEARAPAPQPAAPPVATAPDIAGVAIAFGQAAGLKPEQLKQPSAETMERAAQVMRRLVSGLVVMVEARARAKSQMGAEQTGLEFDGNNPLKFARTPEQALAQLLNPAERGFMPAEKAIEDAYFDLQSHQMATLKAMQGALRATLDRFSPAAIKKRAETGGFLSRILPGGRDATLWNTYEREFSGVSEGSDEAFMDVFAKEFRQAYDELSRNRNR